jgi:hypothetical protein
MVSAKDVKRGCTRGIATAGSNQGTPRVTLVVSSSDLMFVKQAVDAACWINQHYYQHANHCL